MEQTIMAATALRLSGLEHTLPDNLGIDTILRGWVDDKGYDPGSIVGMSNRGEFTNFLRSFIFAGVERGPRTSLAPYDYFGKRLRASTADHRLLHNYRGDTRDDIRFRTANTAYNNGPENFFGEGAAARYDRITHSLSREASRVSIGVVGGGAAGIMTARALTRLGFSVVLFNPEKSGIWSRKNVHEGSRNNPRALSFLERRLDPAPGGGDEVLHYIERLRHDALDSGRMHEITEKVTKIIPGYLRHTVIAGGKEHVFPIVVNAIGHGEPRKLNDPSRMEVIGETPASLRWQRVGLTAEEVRGKRYIFIGLGNSTAEMINQLHKLEDSGHEVDYRIITHYPADSIMNPSDVVHDKGRNYRVFRDTSAPNLTSYQGDLAASRTDYFRALYNNKIIPGVTSWGSKKRTKKFGYKVGDKMEEIEFDSLYALTGYAQSAERLEPFGCHFDTETLAVRYDYDGEMVKDPTAREPEKRLHLGYFGIGAVTDAPHNRNAIVIPGMISGIPPLLGGVVLRAEQAVRAIAA